ncbi:kelch-like protein 38 [Paramacrobiotus metropolitanus]|uniref:kelch-like protein 38 n=1 Tax=Paramacrobiotus metropolitanus TaxID=2943436 RepID=UPI0024463BE7|nr:kelch-like protein 38 [Paramacrobiotus metropolitanus]
MDCSRITRSYTARTLHQLDLLRAGYQWTDIVLSAEEAGIEFPAHKCVLASASPYFNAMLRNNAFVEAEKKTIVLKGVTEKGIRLLLQFIYSGQITLSMEFLEEALKIATLTQVDELIAVCENFLIDSIELDSCVDIWHHAVVFSLHRLQNRILDFTGRNLTNIDQKVLLRFEGDFMIRLLRDTVITSLETTVLNIVVQWIQFNYKCREKYAKKFLNHIYWDRIHMRDTRAVSVKCVKPLRQLIIDSSKSPPPSVPRGMQRCILMLGGFGLDGPTNEIKFVTINNKTGNVGTVWKPLTRLPMKYRTVDFATCPLPDGGILICGGAYFDDNMNESRTSSVYIYDVHNNRWILANSMKKARSGCVSVWFRNFVYVFGGDEDGHSTYERYNLCNNSWEFIGMCPFSAENFALCTTKDRILISGGLENFDSPCRDFWAYDPENALWSRLLPLPVTCNDHCMFYHAKKVYSVGGWTVKAGEQIILKEVFAFTPESGWQRENWDVPFAKAFQQYVFTGKHLAVIGGGSLKASDRLPQQKSNLVKNRQVSLTYFDLAAKEWENKGQDNLIDAIWDHETVVAFLPISASYEN